MVNWLELYYFYRLFSFKLLEFLEANDQPRPLTIRSNSLKTRRGELARTLINRLILSNELIFI